MKISTILKIITVFALTVIIASAGCISDTEDDSSKIKIAVSIIPEETFVNAVCKDMADVIVMIPPSSSPENYEPTPLQMTKLENADIYFGIGVPAEVSILETISDKSKIVSLNEAASEEYDELTLGCGRDPHIWLSPKRAEVMVQKIADEVSLADPDNSSIYQRNADSYIQELQSLDSELTEKFAEIKNKKFIVYHPAFAYFADDYGLEMYALEEGGKEASIQHMKEMIDLAKAEGIKVIFYQDEIDSSQSQAFAEEIGGSSYALSPLAADYINNLRTMADKIIESLK
ncbi:MAG TPA: zinc ABC transporter substrate-binding protein [Methanocorpusculum sp.]|nr:zinc ABC transporter substrate-binding protein [Methanocorpusculum sp.]